MIREFKLGGELGARSEERDHGIWVGSDDWILPLDPRLVIAEKRKPIVVSWEVSDVRFFHNTLRCHNVPLKLSYFKDYPHFMQTFLPNACITTHCHYLVYSLNNWQNACADVAAAPLFPIASGEKKKVPKKETLRVIGRINSCWQYVVMNPYLWYYQTDAWVFFCIDRSTLVFIIIIVGNNFWIPELDFYLAA